MKLLKIMILINGVFKELYEGYYNVLYG